MWLAEPSSVLRVCDQLAAGGWVEAIERGPGRHGVSNAFFVYLRDPDGHRIELYTCDYYTGDPDHPPKRWSVTDPRAGRSGARARPTAGTRSPRSCSDLDGGSSRRAPRASTSARRSWPERAGAAARPGVGSRGCGAWSWCRRCSRRGCVRGRGRSEGRERLGPAGRGRAARRTPDRAERRLSVDRGARPPRRDTAPRRAHRRTADRRLPAPAGAGARRRAGRRAALPARTRRGAPADRRGRRHRLRHRARLRPGLQRPGAVALRAGRGECGGGAARPRHPRRGPALPRGPVPGRRQRPVLGAVGRHLRDAAHRLLHARRPAAAGRAVGDGARQPRDVRAGRAGVVPVLRPERHDVPGVPAAVRPAARPRSRARRAGQRGGRLRRGRSPAGPDLHDAAAAGHRARAQVPARVDDDPPAAVRHRRRARRPVLRRRQPDAPARRPGRGRPAGLRHDHLRPPAPAADPRLRRRAAQPADDRQRRDAARHGLRRERHRHQRRRRPGRERGRPAGVGLQRARARAPRRVAARPRTTSRAASSRAAS